MYILELKNTLTLFSWTDLLIPICDDPIVFRSKSPGYYLDGSMNEQAIDHMKYHNILSSRKSYGEGTGPCRMQMGLFKKELPKEKLCYIT